jgi:hypothetical protein
MIRLSCDTGAVNDTMTVIKESIRIVSTAGLAKLESYPSIFLLGFFIEK